MFHNSCNKSEKWKDRKQPESGPNDQSGPYCSTSDGTARFGLIIKRVTMSDWETPHQYEMMSLKGKD